MGNSIDNQLEYGKIYDVTIDGEERKAIFMGKHLRKRKLEHPYVIIVRCRGWYETTAYEFSESYSLSLIGSQLTARFKSLSLGNSERAYANTLLEKAGL